MEIESHSGNVNFECQKRRLFETAEWTLLRLNQTINEMKSWSREREILTSDIYRLKIALGYSEKLLADPLVMHQSQEIHRLEKMNNDMRMKVESMSVALMNAERTVSWNVDRKVRCEMATVKCQVAEEKLHLAREIARLRSELNEAKVDNTVYHQIREKLDKYVEGDRQFDAIVAEAAGKLIDTVCQLSSELIKVGQDNVTIKVSEASTPPLKLLGNGVDVDAVEIANEVNRLQPEKQLLLKEMEKKFHKIFMEKELKVRALRRVASSLRTKLIISLGRNKKLCEKLNDFEDAKNTEASGKAPVQTDASGNRQPTSTDSVDFTGGELRPSNEKLITREDNCRDTYDVEGLSEKLMRIIDEKEKLVDQLEMERTTTREALREFEKSVKESERKNEEIKRIEMSLSTTKKELKKLKIKNREFRLFISKTPALDKKIVTTKINILRMKLRKVTRNLDEKNREISSLESERNFLKAEKVDPFSKMNFENLKRVDVKEEQAIPEEDFHLSQLKTEDISRDDEDVLDETDERGVGLKEFRGREEVEGLKLSGLEVENAASRAIERANTEDTCASGVPQRVKTSSENLQVSYDVKHESKEAEVMAPTELPNCISDSWRSQRDCVSARNFYLMVSRSSEGINWAGKCPWIIERSDRGILEVQNGRNCGSGSDEGIASANVQVIDRDRTDYDGDGAVDKPEETMVRGPWTIENNSREATTPEMIMRNLKDANRELYDVKSDLSSVTREIGSLRKELDSRRFTNRILKRENAGLKEEVERMRGMIFRVEEKNRKLMKLGKFGGNL
ncbi:uncharacterized protein LOC135166890 [Diachasmimorpha longicaudata]|uniref:uncharacterized protein LOC135166890 n=1 Tax=Diachasmimorpha longicaudata TaxID=58733 RepID=UPI0030B8C0E1